MHIYISICCFHQKLAVLQSLQSIVQSVGYRFSRLVEKCHSVICLGFLLGSSFLFALVQFIPRIFAKHICHRLYNRCLPILWCNDNCTFSFVLFVFDLLGTKLDSLMLRWDNDYIYIFVHLHSKPKQPIYI